MKDISVKHSPAPMADLPPVVGVKDGPVLNDDKSVTVAIAGKKYNVSLNGDGSAVTVKGPDGKLVDLDARIATPNGGSLKLREVLGKALQEKENAVKTLMSAANPKVEGTANNKTNAEAVVRLDRMSDLLVEPSDRRVDSWNDGVSANVLNQKVKEGASGVWATVASDLGFKELDRNYYQVENGKVTTDPVSLNTDQSVSVTVAGKKYNVSVNGDGTAVTVKGPDGKLVNLDAKVKGGINKVDMPLRKALAMALQTKENAIFKTMYSANPNAAGSANNKTNANTVARLDRMGDLLNDPADRKRDKWDDDWRKPDAGGYNTKEANEAKGVYDPVKPDVTYTELAADYTQKTNGKSNNVQSWEQIDGKKFPVDMNSDHSSTVTLPDGKKYEVSLNEDGSAVTVKKDGQLIKLDATIKLADGGELPIRLALGKALLEKENALAKQFRYASPTAEQANDIVRLDRMSDLLGPENRRSEDNARDTNGSHGWQGATLKFRDLRYGEVQTVNGKPAIAPKTEAVLEPGSAKVTGKTSVQVTIGNGQKYTLGMSDDGSKITALYDSKGNKVPMQDLDKVLSKVVGKDDHGNDVTLGAALRASLKKEEGQLREAMMSSAPDAKYGANTTANADKLKTLDQFGDLLAPTAKHRDLDQYYDDTAVKRAKEEGKANVHEPVKSSYQFKDLNKKA